MTRLFGTNGIREVVGETLTAPFVTRVTSAIAAMVPPGPPVVVGWDARTSSPAFARIASGTLAIAGHRVVEVGCLPTPAIQFLVPRLRAQIGVVITASHNPPEFNGIKCIGADGLEVDRSFEEGIERGVDQEVTSALPYSRIGEVAFHFSGGHEYITAIAGHVDAAAIAKRHPTVVLDCGNGASCGTSPYLLRMLGCRVVTLNAQPDGNFPGHLSEPTVANLADLAHAVPALGADLGIAHDGDADRAVFVDHTGRYVPGEEALTLMARDAVERHRGGIVVTPVSASQSVEDAVRPLGGEVVYTRIGSPTVTHEMQVRKAIFGGEENGGLIFPYHQLARDGAMSAAAVLDLLARRQQSLADALRDLPHYTLVKEKVSCPVELRAKVLTHVTDAFTKESEKVVTIDGVKAYRDGGWVLLRPSGTEPLFRVFAEAKDPVRARALAETGLEAVRSALRELGSGK
jgi:phosphomannomutase / phosphoglucomutase